MLKYLKISILIFCVLALSRFVPHPPNFTSLLALSFYVPVLLGLRYLPALLVSFAITDLIIGYHTGTHWTWGSVLIIGLVSQNYSKNVNTRILGSISGACIFFIVTNFGVWFSGMYSYTIQGLIESYFLAIPFFAYSLISTFIFSAIIEFLLKLKFIKAFKLI